MRIAFQSSDAALESGGTPEHVIELPGAEFVQLTYEGLRVGPDGEHVAVYQGGYWRLSDNTNRFFSDVVIS